MSAIKFIDVIRAEKKSGQGKNGPYEFLALQGTMHYEDGTVEVFVYDWWSRKGEPTKEVKPGRYVPVVEIRANTMTRKLEGQLTDLRKAA